MLFNIIKFRKVDNCEQKKVYVLRVGCKSPFNIVKLIEINVDLEDEFKKIKNSFEWDDVVDTYNLVLFLLFGLYI